MLIKMKHLSTFSGVGGFDLALGSTGEIETVAFVERDPHCQDVLTHHWPDRPIFSDIKEVTVEELKKQFGYIDIFTGGFPCFVAGTLVLTERGYQPIEEVTVRDSVLSHTGKWRRVTSIMSRWAATTRSIKGMGIAPIVTTDEHPFYARKMTSVYKDRTNQRVWESAEWLNAKDLKPAVHFVGQTIPIEKIDDQHSENFWWVVGRYLADGWRVNRKNRKTGRVVICAGKLKAEELANQLLIAGFHAVPVEERTVVKFHILDKELFHFLSDFGKYAHGKKLPGIYLGLSAEKASSLLRGYLSGDGSYKDGKWRATTVSQSLALSLGLLAQVAYGVVASVHYVPVPETTIIEGRTVKQRPQWQVVIPPRNCSAFVEDNYGWKLIRENEITGGAVVYNISVEEDESYIANGCIVHNCQDVSVAGLRKGLAGARTGLWFEFLRLVEGMLPEWVILENVPGLLSSNGGEDFATILQGLAKCGYGVAWRILDAKNFGVPQRRRRVFVVGHLGDGRAAEVLFECGCLQGDIAPRKRQGEVLAGTLKGGSGKRGFPDPSDGNGGGLIVEPATSFWNGTQIADTLDVSSLVKQQMMPEKNRFAAVIEETNTPAIILRNGGRDSDKREGRTGVGLDIVIYENHAQDSRITESVGISPTLHSKMGTGGNNVPLVEAVDGRNLTVGDVSPTLQAKQEGYSLNFTPMALIGSEAEDGINTERHTEDGPSHDLYQTSVDGGDRLGENNWRQAQVSSQVSSQDGPTPSEEEAGVSGRLFDNHSNAADDSPPIGHSDNMDSGPADRLPVSHLTPPIAFLAGQSAKAGTIGASETLSPTLKGASSGTNQVPSVLTAGADRIDHWQEDDDKIRAVQGNVKSSTVQEHVYFKSEAGVVNTIEANRPPKIITGTIIRRFTPVETELLQGFPYGWTAMIGERPHRLGAGQLEYYRRQLEANYGRPITDDEVHRVVSDSHRYRQMGNAIALPAVVWVAQRLVWVKNNPPSELSAEELRQAFDTGEQLSLF